MYVNTVSGSSPNALPAIRLGATTKMNVTNVSFRSAELGCELVRLVATTDCHIAIGADPVAGPDSPLLPANISEYFVVVPTDKIAVIRDAADGALYVTVAA
jgi:hypothetical protein